MAHRTALEGFKIDFLYDAKLDDKSGSFVVAYKTNYIFTANKDIAKQCNIQREKNVNNVDISFERIKTEIACVVDICRTSGELSSTTADFVKHKG